MRSPIARSLVLNWSILIAEGRGSLASLMVRRWAHCWKKRALKIMKRTTSQDLDFLFQEGVWHSPSYYIWTVSVCRVGQWETIVKKVRRSCPCVTTVGFWSRFFTELLLDLHISKCSHVNMHLAPSSEPEEVIRPFISHTSIDFILFYFLLLFHLPLCLSLCCLLKCAVQQEKEKIILLPAMQDGSQKARVKCSVSFLKLL